MGLTTRQVRDAKPGTKPIFLRDDDPRGLALRVGPDGRKSWTLDYRNVSGRKRRWTIGTAEAFSLSQAREAARDAQRGLAAGIDPLDERAARKARITVAELCDRYLSEYAPQRLDLGKLKPRTVHGYKRQIEGVIVPALGAHAVADVTSTHVERMVRKMAPVYRNRVLALTSRLFRLAEDWHLRPQNTNPARGVDRASESERTRILSADELAALGRALSDMDKANPWAILAIRLAALTGLRIGEVRGIRWEDLDMKTGRLELPDTKTGARVHTLPAPALALLADAPEVGPYIIAGKTDRAPLDYSAIRNVFAEARKRAGCETIRLHDLRRSAMTRAASRGASVPLLQDLLGHKTSAMALRYVKMAGDEADRLREAIGSETAALMGGTGASTTVRRLR
ncbi:MAG: tyrosine-type recombinase/integrase [Shimia sp.]